RRLAVDRHRRRVAEPLALRQLRLRDVALDLRGGDANGLRKRPRNAPPACHDLDVHAGSVQRAEDLHDARLESPLRVSPLRAYRAPDLRDDSLTGRSTALRAVADFERGVLADLERLDHERTAARA